MAIVFISAKDNQKVFFGGITALMIAFLVIVFSVVLLPEIISKNTAPKVIPPDATITVDLSKADSPEVKNLTPFSGVQTQFSYIAQDASGKTIGGTIMAADETSAKSSLKDMGLTVISLQPGGV